MCGICHLVPRNPHKAVEPEAFFGVVKIGHSETVSRGLRTCPTSWPASHRLELRLQLSRQRLSAIPAATL
jgi:hypothetical protein